MCTLTFGQVLPILIEGIVSFSTQSDKFEFTHKIMSISTVEIIPVVVVQVKQMYTVLYVHVVIWHLKLRKERSL